jgi:serine/threonine-protein kinase
VTLSRGREPRGASWGPGGTIVFAELRSPLQRISASGGPSEPLPLVAARANVRWPVFLPGGENVLYTLADFSGDYDKARLAVVSLRTGRSKIVLDGGTYGRYVPPGYLVYLHSNTLFAVPFNAASLTVTGTGTAIADDVESYPSKGLAHFVVSSDGSLFYIPRARANARDALVSVDRAGNITPLAPVRQAYDEPRLSPDAKRLVIAISSGSDSDLWIYDIAVNSWTRLTNGGRNLTGLWSPDGKQIAFASNRDSGFDLYVIPADTSAPPAKITARASWPFPSSWTPDGRAVAVAEQFRDRHADVFVQPVTPKSAPRPLLTEPYDENFAVFSSDGRWIAYQSNESGRFEIYVQRYPQGGAKWMISSDGGTFPVWRRDMRELFFRSGNRMIAVDVRLGGEPHFEKPRLLFQGDFEQAFDVYPDGQRFVMVQRLQSAPVTRINVILGLFDHLNSSRDVQRGVR